MSRWNHAICQVCWAIRCLARGEPGREAVRVVRDVRKPCCFCGQPTSWGAYVRQPPETPPCRGKHGWEA